MHGTPSMVPQVYARVYPPHFHSKPSLAICSHAHASSLAVRSCVQSKDRCTQLFTFGFDHGPLPVLSTVIHHVLIQICYAKSCCP